MFKLSTGSRADTETSVARSSLLRFMVAGFAAGLAVEQPIFAKPDTKLRLAETAVLFAIAAVLCHFALGAVEFLEQGSHMRNVARHRSTEKCRW